MRTVLCDLLNIDYPVIQGGMAWTATAELVAAVSEAGGIGIIGSGHMPGDLVRDQIRKAKALTNKPFGINVMLMNPFVEDVMEVIFEEKVALVTTGAGNPGKYIPRLKELGIKVIPVIPSVALAQRMERVGADAIIAEGTESGGHIGELTTMVMVPQVVDAVKIPVIAAGGIADGRGFAAALALGAVGVQMGTRFMVAEECVIHPNIKNAIIKAKDRDTIATGRSTGHPVRCIKNKFTRQLEKMEKQGRPSEELEEAGTGKLKIAMIDGDVENGSIMAGQIAGMVSKMQPAKEIIHEIITEAEKTIARLGVQ